jgi:hypothetical protein
VEAGDVTLLGGDVSVSLPEISSAAWRAAQASQAAPYLDYGWVIRVARGYESYEIYASIQNELVSAMANLVGGPPEIDDVRVLYGRLVILADVHGQLIERLEAILAEGGVTPRS